MLESLPQLQDMDRTVLKRRVLFGGGCLALVIAGYGLRAVTAPTAQSTPLDATAATLNLTDVPPIPLDGLKGMEHLEEATTAVEPTALTLSPELAAIPCEPLDQIGKACSRKLDDGSQVLSARAWTPEELEILENGGNHDDIKALHASQPSEPLSALVSEP